MRWLVNRIRAVTPSTGGAASASWTACASGLGGGTEPPPVAASAIAAQAAAVGTTAPHSASRRPGEMRRRNVIETSVAGHQRVGRGDPARVGRHDVRVAASEDEPQLDPRFSLANERTFLAWIRTSLALVAGGVVAAKALEFNHDALRWIVAVPPIVVGGVLALESTRRWRLVQDAMEAGRPMPVGRGLRAIGVFICAYAVLVLVASAVDG